MVGRVFEKGRVLSCLRLRHVVYESAALIGLRGKWNGTVTESRAKRSSLESVLLRYVLFSTAWIGLTWHNMAENAYLSLFPS